MPEGREIFALQIREQGAHAAGDVESNAACGNDSAGFGVECGYAADGKTIPPMRVWHGKRCVHDARKLGVRHA